MQRKAVITSSEAQGEKASPREQETDCRSLAQEKELTVVRVYRDIEKYRVKKKLVEPSGLRTDRPGLQGLLKDVVRGEFDVILAWREDRLYRGLRSMLLVLEAVELYKITILLAKETFDPKIAPIRAWAAQLELESMRERMTMGVIAASKPARQTRDRIATGTSVLASRSTFWKKKRNGCAKPLRGTSRKLP